MPIGETEINPLPSPLAGLRFFVGMEAVHQLVPQSPEKELNKKSVCKDFLYTADDGKTYKTAFYNLDVVISVGYRVKSKRGT